MGSVFQDPDEAPTDAAIRAALGPHPQAWERVSSVFADAGTVIAWRHYRDGGWLAKATRGGKTVAWLAVEDGFVRVTFYFADRHRAALAQAPGLGDDARDRIASSPLTGRLLPVTFETRESSDLDPVRVVLAFKLSAT